MATRIHRMPRRVVLPFGYVISVVQLEDDEMRKLDPNDELQDGVWDVETKTISLRKCLSLRRRRYIVSHELGHALLDFQHEFLDLGSMRA